MPHSSDPNEHGTRLVMVPLWHSGSEASVGSLHHTAGKRASPLLTEGYAWGGFGCGRCIRGGWKAPAFWMREPALKPLRSSWSPREQQQAMIGLVLPCCAERTLPIVRRHTHIWWSDTVEQNKSPAITNEQRMWNCVKQPQNAQNRQL